MRVNRASFALWLDIDMDGFGCGTTSTRKRNRDDDEDVVVDEEALRVDKVHRPLACPKLPLTPFSETAKRQRDCSIAFCTPPPAFRIALTTLSVPPLLHLLSSAAAGQSG
jgi:hypothetical protein